MRPATTYCAQAVRRALHVAVSSPTAGVTARVPGAAPARWLARASSSVAAPPRRDSRFSRVCPEHLDALGGMVCGGAPSGVVRDEDELAAYNQDWMGKWKGDAPAALRPKTTGERRAACGCARVLSCVRVDNVVSLSLHACATRGGVSGAGILQRAQTGCRAARVSPLSYGSTCVLRV